MYCDTHRYFLQYMLKDSCISTGKALEFCRKLDDNVSDVNTLKTFISEINEKISNQELKISFLKCEVTGDDKLSLLNTGNDDTSKLQNVFTPVELEYFQLLLKEIIVSEDHKLKKMSCFNLSNSLTGTLRKDAVEKLLKSWINGGYLVEKDAYIYLGPRCIVEFTPYFQIHCKDYYTNCNLCSEVVFTGKTCSSCNKIMHSHCMEKYLTKQNKCPNCKSEWEEAEHRVASQRDQNESTEDEHSAASQQTQNDSSEDASQAGPSRQRKSRRLM